MSDYLPRTAPTTDPARALCQGNHMLGHCGCWWNPDDGTCCWCTASNDDRESMTQKTSTPPTIHGSEAP